jgi:beta-galactosidase
VTTPQISTAAANVNVKTEAVNDYGNDSVCTVVNTVLDPEGREVASVRSQQSVPASTTITFDQTTAPIVRPRLWTPATPNLYHVETAIYLRGRLVDNFESPLGFRWMEWTPERGFFLNGQHYYFHGSNVHQDHAGWCDAVADTGIYRDVQLIKEAGFDFIRGSHYSHSPKFTDACDRLGVMFWSENCFWGVGLPNTGGDWTRRSGFPPNPNDIPAFDQNVLDTLADMIRIHRNHPSVIIWSMSNEIFNAGNKAGMQDLLTQEVNLTHQLDPSRKAAIGGAQRGGVENIHPGHERSPG